MNSVQKGSKVYMRLPKKVNALNSKKGNPNLLRSSRVIQQFVSVPFFHMRGNKKQNSTEKEIVCFDTSKFPEMYIHNFVDVQSKVIHIRSDAIPNMEPPARTS